MIEVESTWKPGEPVFVCLIKNTLSSRFYLDYGPSELAARNQTLTTCQRTEGNLAFHCARNETRCDSFTSPKQSFTCAISNTLTDLVFTETGRSPLEAEAKARRACSDAEHPFHCEQEEVQCN
jgi:hypothetical protein